MNLKLYVWNHFNPDYHEGLAFAVAENQGEAMRMVQTQLGYEPSYWGPCKVLKLNKKIAFARTGGS